MRIQTKESALQLRRRADSHIEDNSPETLLQAFTYFINDYCLPQLYSKRTIECYREGLKSFIAAKGDMSPSELTHLVYSEWVVVMYERGNKKITIHTNVSKLRVFVGYMNDRGWCPLTKEEIKVPKKPRTVVRYAKRSDVDVLIRHAKCLRNKAIFALMFSTGLRRSEVCCLKRSSVDLANGELRVEHGKGDKEAILFLDNRSKDLLAKYWATRTDSLPWAFVSGSEYTEHRRLSSQAVQYMFNTTSAKAGIYFTAKDIRHGFATELMRQNVHIRLIQEAMRHEFLTTTQMYTHVETSELKSSVLQALNNA